MNGLCKGALDPKAQSPASIGSMRPRTSSPSTRVSFSFIGGGRVLRSRTQHLAVSCEAGAKLAELEISTILDQQGFVTVDEDEVGEAAVFAVYDSNKKLQYIGFSKDLGSSLRTVFSRRPDKAFYFKAAHLEKLDQDEMMKIRSEWFEEVGGPPPGNKLAMERSAWQQPADAGAISQKGRLQAATDKAKVMQDELRKRGCKEEFIPDPKLMAEGMVDFLPAAKLDPEELAKRRAEMEEIAKASRASTTMVDDELREFSVFFRDTYKTNGGYMFDVQVTYENQDTTHRVIVGKDYYEEQGIEAEEVIVHTFGFMLSKEIPRQTEGLLLSSQFPSNYFSISELDQWFPDFADTFKAKFGKPVKEERMWLWNRVHDYGPVDESLEGLNIALGNTGK